MSEVEMFQPCSDQLVESENKQVGVSIFFVSAKNFDLSPFATLQALSATTGLHYGDHVLPEATQVIFVDGSRTDREIYNQFEMCLCEKDLSKVNILSISSYNARYKAVQPAADFIPITNATLTDGLEKQANDTEHLCTIFYDVQSLTAGGSLCKTVDLCDLHNCLKAQGSTQLYFVNSEAEATKIAVKPDLIFMIRKVGDTLLPTIKLTLSSSSSRIEDSILPLELELQFNNDGTWGVTESVKRQDQDEAIKVLALAGKTRIQIAEILGMAPSTVGRRLKEMEQQGLIIIKGHQVLRA